jgi:hypothetical protein
MARPVGVSAIGCWCLLAGVYFCSVSALIVFAPAAALNLSALPFLHALKLMNPYFALAIGAAWALVAWGLFRMRDWARFAATIILGIGVAWALPTFLLARHSYLQILIAVPEIVVRVAAIAYLLSPSVLDAFIVKRSEPALRR